MNRFYSISKAATELGVSISTLRRWESEGKLVPQRTKGNQRRYSPEQIMGLVRKVTPKPDRITLAYARVSSADQKKDLERQKTVLEMYCAAQGWNFELISDLGSGMNYRKKGLQSLLQKLLNGKIERLVITHKDRLLRFGAELIFSVCEMKGVEVVIVNKGEEASFEKDLAKDVLEIITVFSARLYGSRSKKNQKLINGMKKAVKAAQ
ncbi:IS607 family transposase [Parasutterella secunda]|uniref:IS607 family transposase n=2 Tax=Parasutterella secunda TaxID=626947 RepID=UPI0025A3256F|nr:IS607 family transposase [Parasutterella secunda]MDM8088074.1 IS607 family transposase [Parasutterella secunda]